MSTRVIEKIEHNIKDASWEDMVKFLETHKPPEASNNVYLHSYVHSHTLREDGPLLYSMTVSWENEGA